MLNRVIATSNRRSIAAPGGAPALRVGPTEAGPPLDGRGLPAARLGPFQPDRLAALESPFGIKLVARPKGRSPRILLGSPFEFASDKQAYRANLGLTVVGFMAFVDPILSTQAVFSAFR